MSEVTSKLRLILPKTLAVKCGVRPGADVPKAPKGANRAPAGLDTEASLRIFDAATARQEAGQANRRARGRGWTREDLYERGRSRTR